MIGDEQRKVRICALQCWVTVRMAVDRHNAIRVFHDDVTMRIHTEGTDNIPVALCSVKKLCLVDLARDVVPNDFRHLDANPYIDAIILLFDAEPLAFFRKPLCPRTPWRDDEILCRQMLA